MQPRHRKKQQWKSLIPKIPASMYLPATSFRPPRHKPWPTPSSALFGAQLPETLLDRRCTAQRQHDDQIPGLRPGERLLESLKLFFIVSDLLVVGALLEQFITDNAEDIAMFATAMVGRKF